MNRDFVGTGVALITPFNDDLSIDFGSLEKIINRCLQSGVDYLVTLGTTSEAPTLDESEKVSVAEFVIKATDGRVPVVIGIGHNNTQKLIKELGHYDHLNYNGVLSVSPYYNKPSQPGLLNHFRKVADSSPKPVLLYNIPGRTGVRLNLETIKELSTHKNIVGVKESTENISLAIRMAAMMPKNFLIISGDDVLTLPIMSVGGKGAISVIANMFPEQFSQMVNACLENDYDRAREINFSFLDINKAIMEEGNPIGVKYAMSKLGLCKPHVREPLVMPSEKLKDKIDKLLKREVAF